MQFDVQIWRSNKQFEKKTTKNRIVVKCSAVQLLTWRLSCDTFFLNLKDEEAAEINPQNAPHKIFIFGLCNFNIKFKNKRNRVFKCSSTFILSFCWQREDGLIDLHVIRRYIHYKWQVKYTEVLLSVEADMRRLAFYIFYVTDNKSALIC